MGKQKIKFNYVYSILFILIFSPKVFGRDYIGMILGCGLLIYMFLNRKVIVNINLSIFSIYIYIIYMELFYILFGRSNINMAIRNIFYAIIPIVFFILGKNLSRYYRNINIFKIINIISIVQFFICFLQIINPKMRNITMSLYGDLEKYTYSFEQYGWGRAIGSLGNPNVLALFASIGICFSMYSVLNNMDKKIMNSIVIVLNIVVVLLSKSRTGLILTLVGIILIILVSKINFRKKALYLLFIGIAIFFTLNANLAVIERFSADTASTMGGRTETWKSAISSIKESGLLNQFIGNGPLWLKSININTADNYYVNTLVVNGIFGLMLLAFTYFETIKMLINKKNQLGSILIVVIILLCIADVTGAYYRHVKVETFFYFVLGISLYNTKCEEQ